MNISVNIYDLNKNLVLFMKSNILLSLSKTSQAENFNRQKCEKEMGTCLNRAIKNQTQEQCICSDNYTVFNLPLTFQDQFIGIVQCGPFLNGDDMQQIVQIKFIQELIHYIVIQHEETIAGQHSLNFLVSYMKENFSENIKLHQIADLMGKSESRISHLFKEVYGKSFKEIQSEIKISKADEIMKKYPFMNIKDIAIQVGFEDPLYFSKFYKRNTGISPSEKLRSDQDNIKIEA